MKNKVKNYILRRQWKKIQKASNKISKTWGTTYLFHCLFDEIGHAFRYGDYYDEDENMVMEVSARAQAFSTYLMYYNAYKIETDKEIKNDFEIQMKNCLEDSKEGSNWIKEFKEIVDLE